MSMEASKDIIEIVEDYTRVTDYLGNLCCAIENPKVEMPNFIPVCNDSLVTDRLTTITEHIKDLRKKLV
jgi:hypothetical protein